MKDIIVNGAEYRGKSRVQLTTAAGGTALFRDEDEIVGMESGTITPTEDSKFLAIPMSSRKTHFCMWADIGTAIDATLVLAHLSVFAVDGEGLYFTQTNANGTNTYGLAVAESNYTATTEDNKPCYAIFADDSVKLGISIPTNMCKFYASQTYKWVAW